MDNLPTRRVISAVGWPLAIDAGLGAGPTDFNGILVVSLYLGSTDISTAPASQPADVIAARLASA